MDPAPLDLDQRREIVNTYQRFEALREAERRLHGFRGSLIWSRTNGTEYLLKSAYDRQGKRRQRSLGPRSADTEALKATFETERASAEARVKDLKAVMIRQASINRALRIGRMPVESAKILRALDRAGLLGGKLRVLGSLALYAYEAVAGVRLDAAYLDTGDINLLFQPRAHLSLAGEADLHSAPTRALDTSLLKILQSVDRSFARSAQPFRAVNRDGFLVDLITPLREPPRAANPDRLGSDPDDLAAVEIEGLSWHESAPAFEAIVIDARGEPCRIVASDPRVFAAHKLWLSERRDREAVKRDRDAAQARAVGALVARHMPHLPFERADLRMLPTLVFDAAASLFAPGEP